MMFPEHYVEAMSLDMKRRWRENFGVTEDHRLIDLMEFLLAEGWRPPDGITLDNESGER